MPSARPLLGLVLLAAFSSLATTAAAQATTRIDVDLGVSTIPTDPTTAEAWNDVDETNMAVPFELVDSSGAPTGVQWSLPGTLFTGANSAGTATPTPGSALAEFPVAATRDVVYGQNGAVVTIQLDGFPANTLVDFMFAASRTGVTDMRTTEYRVQGFNAGVAKLDPSNNVSETVSVDDILVDAAGGITITVQAAPENTNLGTHYFYLGALRMDVTTNATTPAVLAFDQPAVSVARDEGAAPFATTITMLESTGASPAIALSATDDATGLAPSWLGLPAGAAIGVPFSATFDAAALAHGDYSATIVAQASGYPDAILKASLSVEDPATLNLLCYGNSYSQFNLGVPSLVGFIAEDAGHPAPNVVAKLVGGQNLLFHLTDPDQAAAITTALPLGAEWDFVVMQGFSLEATSQLGDPAAFQANALAILANVKAHSPGARAVMYQTWARGPGSTYYPNTYASPLEMHAEIRSNYRAAVDAMNATWGAGTAFVGAAGDTVALLAFDDALYTSDWSHPEPPTTLMAASTIYQAIWRERVCDVQPDFSGSSNLVTRLAAIGLGQSDWEALTGIAERAADPELRRYPGSSEDLLLKSGVDGPALACPLKVLAAGQHLSLELDSPNDLYDQAGFLILDAFFTGSPPGTGIPWPEVQFDLGSAFVVATAPALSSGGGLTFDLDVTIAAPGFSLLAQGLAIGASATTGNPLFATTDGHELVLQ